MIMKKENPDSGIITIRKDAKIGLLKQIPFLQEVNAECSDSQVIKITKTKIDYVNTKRVDNH